MLIQILQRAISLDRKFDVAINGKVKYFVKGYGIGPFSSYTLSRGRNTDVLYMYKKWTSVLSHFNIYFNRDIYKDKEPIKFKTESFSKNKYVCKSGVDVYEIYAHLGLKFSIFCNGVQIAGIDQDKWTSFKEDGFRLECNKDVSKELIIAFTILLNHIHNRQVGFLDGLFTRNVGVLQEMAPYDLNWKPK